jgi:hypothetical protein
LEGGLPGSRLPSVTLHVICWIGLYLTFRHDGQASVQTADTAAMPAPRPKLPRINFYPIRAGDSDEWRVLAHCPGTPLKYISGFASRAEAEAWASGPEVNAWIRANYQPGE